MGDKCAFKPEIMVDCGKLASAEAFGDRCDANSGSKMLIQCENSFTQSDRCDLSSTTIKLLQLGSSLSCGSKYSDKCNWSYSDLQHKWGGIHVLKVCEGK